MDAKQLGALTPRADRAVLLELAERCEREVPSVMLDVEIECAINSAARPCDAGSRIQIGLHIRFAKPFTSSRDAAASLMPEDLSVNVVTGGMQGELTYVEVFISEDIHWCDAHAPTEAQARAAAALRAMAA